MKIKIISINQISFIPENDSDRAILKNMGDKFIHVFEATDYNSLEEVWGEIKTGEQVVEQERFRNEP